MIDRDREPSSQVMTEPASSGPSGVSWSVVDCTGVYRTDGFVEPTNESLFVGPPGVGACATPAIPSFARLPVPTQSITVQTHGSAPAGATVPAPELPLASCACAICRLCWNLFPSQNQFPQPRHFRWKQLPDERQNVLSSSSACSQTSFGSVGLSRV